MAFLQVTIPVILEPDAGHTIFASSHNFPYMFIHCLLYTSPSPRDKRQSRMPSSA